MHDHTAPAADDGLEHTLCLIADQAASDDDVEGHGLKEKAVSAAVALSVLAPAAGMAVQAKPAQARSCPQPRRFVPDRPWCEDDTVLSQPQGQGITGPTGGSNAVEEDVEGHVFMTPDEAERAARLADANRSASPAPADPGAARTVRVVD